MQRGGAVSLLAVIARVVLADSPLVEISRLVDWAPIERELEPLRAAMDRRRGGPAPYSPAAMFRATLLQGWYLLSFPELAQATRLRLDFQVFAGFETGFPVPSASSFCRARKRLEKRGKRNRCLKIVETQLKAAGITVIPAAGAVREIRIERLNRNK